MPRLQSLNSVEKKNFDSPPEFNSFQRKKFFRVNSWSKKILNEIRTENNKVYFILLLGYFNATSQFYPSSTFHNNDIEFVCKQIGVNLSEINDIDIPKQTLHRYRSVILEYRGFRKFDDISREELLKEAEFLSSKLVKPKKIFLSLVDFLRNRQIEIPGYDTLNKIIGHVIDKNEKKLLKQLEKNLSEKQKALLDELIEIDEKYKSGKKSTAKIKRYKLASLKKINYSLKPGKITQNLSQLETCRELYENLSKVIESLNLSSGITDYYFNLAKRSDMYQLNRKNKTKIYLHLICFITHQYFTLQDALIDKMQLCVKHASNQADKEHKLLLLNLQNEQLEKDKQIISHTRSQKEIIEQIYKIATSLNIEIEEKLEQIIKLSEFITSKNVNDCIELLLNELENNNQKIEKNKILFTAFEGIAHKLQLRVSEIVKVINFNQEISDNKLITAIKHYRKNSSTLNKNAPQDFLEEKEQKLLFNDDGKFRGSLYKVLLFQAITHGIKAGTLNLSCSYKYKAFEEYLIPKAVWEKFKEELLKKAGLEKFTDIKSLLEKYRIALSKQYKQTNTNIIKKINDHIKFPNGRKFVLNTPKNQEIQETELFSFFPQQKYISLVEVLNTVENCSEYLSAFEHHSQKNNRAKPNTSLFYAGIMAQGCNIGLNKLAQTSHGIQENELDNTVNWFFSLDNVNTANDRVLSFIKKLELPVLFKKHPYKTHTSSDGQKYQVSPDAENANYSFKYVGKDKCIVEYNHIDDSHLLYFSSVISSSEREAAYVIDGLMHNEVVKSDIHSTDTHGYSEIIFATMQLLGFVFAPRIKNLKDQVLYSFPSETIKQCQEKGYKILPAKYIQTEIIEENWDDILRFIATIKLKETTASQLFKRLTSYSKQNPLYRAMKAFGQIFKSLFILKYIDNVELRQDIEKQLNKIESSNKFSKAVQVGNNNELNYLTKEEQEIAASCKRLIKNSIICWNYLYLSDKLAKSDKKKEEEMIALIKNSSIVIWRHVNFNGMYDFTEEKTKKATDFDIPKILNWKASKMVHDETYLDSFGA